MRLSVDCLHLFRNFFELQHSEPESNPIDPDRQLLVHSI